MTTTQSNPSPWRFVRPVIRILFGALFAFSGISKLFHLMPPPPPDSMPTGALLLSQAFEASGYMMPMIAITELVGGLFILSGFFVPLGLVLLAPVVVNILLFHVFLAPSGNIMGIVLLIIELGLAWSYRHVYLPMLSRRA